MSWHTDIQIALGLWEGLTSYDPETTRPVGGAAKWPVAVSADGLVYTFGLRENARWSNGDALTADDYVFGWRRALEPGSARDYVFLLIDNIAGAGEYYRWRNSAVHILTILRDLKNGRSVSDEEMGLVAGMGPDWAGAADEYREKHRAAMDERFGKVGIKALDERTLEVTLVRPTNYFLDLTAFATFLPIHRSIELLKETEGVSAELTLWAYDPQWVKPDYHRRGYPGLITNGPFRLEQWHFKDYMYFVKNPYYHAADEVVCGSIKARIITGAGTYYMAYERGEVDWLGEVTRLDFAPALAAQALGGERDDIHITPMFGTYFYDFNCQPTLPDGSANPLADCRLRMALNLAVDKQAIVDKVKKIGNVVARNFVPPDSIVGYSCEPGPVYNPKRAGELMAEAGYAGAEGLPPIQILYNNGYGHEEVAQAVAEMWRENLKAEIVIHGKEVKSFAEDKKTHKFMVCRASWFGDYGDPTTFLDMMVTGNGNNDPGFSNAQYDGLMKKAAATLGHQERLEILAAAEYLLMHEQVPILPIYYYVNLDAFRADVKGLYANPRHMHPFRSIHKCESVY